MNALGVATTRSLSIIAHPSIPVIRERVESASIVTRLAPSFIRIGNFQAVNPPERMFFLGGGQQDPNYEALRKLGEWVGRRVLRLPINWEAGEAWGKELVLESARRNATMVAGWQAYGFMHGVINTDKYVESCAAFFLSAYIPASVSILGLTIDYGPYAFMDVFDNHHVCNHSDSESRYSYQVRMLLTFRLSRKLTSDSSGTALCCVSCRVVPRLTRCAHTCVPRLYALRALLSALAPLIGAEAAQGNKAVGHGWAENASTDQMSEWSKQGQEHVLKELEDLFQDTCAEEYKRLMHRVMFTALQFSELSRTELRIPCFSVLRCAAWMLRTSRSCLVRCWI